MAFFAPCYRCTAGGYVATAPSIPAEHEGFSRLKLVKSAASAVFPEYPEIERSQKGMLRCLLVSTVGVRSGNFLVITPLNGNLGAVAVTAGKPTASDLIKKASTEAQITLSDRLCG